MAKYLIIEKDYNTVYAYIEHGEHHKLMSKHRIPACQLTENELNKECDLDAYADGTYFVFELKEKPNGKVKAVKKRKSKVARKARSKKAR